LRIQSALAVNSGLNHLKIKDPHYDACNEGNEGQSGWTRPEETQKVQAGLWKL
jgi:hypothetical protein